MSACMWCLSLSKFTYHLCVCVLLYCPLDTSWPGVVSNISVLWLYSNGIHFKWMAAESHCQPDQHVKGLQSSIGEFPELLGCLGQRQTLELVLQWMFTYAAGVGSNSSCTWTILSVWGMKEESNQQTSLLLDKSLSPSWLGKAVSCGKWRGEGIHTSLNTVIRFSLQLVSFTGALALLCNGVLGFLLGAYLICVCRDAAADSLFMTVLSIFKMVYSHFQWWSTITFHDGLLSLSMTVYSHFQRQSTLIFLEVLLSLSMTVHIHFQTDWNNDTVCGRKPCFINWKSTKQSHPRN